MKRIALLALILLIFSLSGCGKKTVKTGWTANQYLDYALELYNKGKYYKAQNELNYITIQFSGSPIMDKARFYLGMTYYQSKEYITAIYELNRLIREMPQSSYISEAQFYIAMSNFKMSPEPELDQEYTQKALREFQLYIETFPSGKHVVEANRHIAELRHKLSLKLLRSANLYKKNQRYKSAIIYYKKILDNYYDMAEAEDAVWGIGECYYKIKKYEESQKFFDIYAGKYPKGKYLQKIKSILAEIQALSNQ